MRQPGRMNGAIALLCAVVTGLPLAACGSAGDSGIGSTFGNLIAFNSTKAPAPLEIKDKGVEVNCPDVQILDGKSAYRTFTGADKSNESVKYQFSFGELSRECTATSEQISIRVGISGLVLAGPAGGAGNFQVPVRLVIRRDATNQPVVDKLYRIDASIGSGALQAPFTLVTEPLSVPFLHTDADYDYSIYVGFDTATDKPQKPQKPVRASKRRAG